MSIAPEIIGFIKSKVRTIKRELTEAKDGILLQNGMPPNVSYGQIIEGVFKNKFTPEEGIPVNAGDIKSSTDGIVLPVTMLKDLLTIIRKSFLPGGSPIDGSVQTFLGEDSETSNAGVLVLPLLPDERELIKVTRIIESIPSRLGLSILLVEQEPGDLQSVGSMLAEGYLFATKILEARSRTGLRPIVVLPSLKTLNSDVSKEMLKALYETVIEVIPQQYWVKMDAKNEAISRVLTAIGIPGSRSKIVGVSEPFIHSGAKTMIIRTRIAGDVSYPTDALKITKSSSPLIDPDHVHSVLSSHKISEPHIVKFVRSLPKHPPCYSDSHFLSVLGKIFSKVRQLKVRNVVACEIMAELMAGITICNRAITDKDIPQPPPEREKISGSEPSPGARVWYAEEEFITVFTDPDAQLALIIPRDGFVVDRIIVPLSYLFVRGDKYSVSRTVIPGIKTSEYITISEYKKTSKEERGKKTVNIELNDECVLERGIFLESDAPHWGGVDGYSVKWDKTNSNWILTIKDESYTRKGKWSEGWLGEYTKPGDTSKYFVSERHGSMYDGAKRFISQNSYSLDGINLAFSGRPEYTNSFNEYICVRLGIISAINKQKGARLILHPIGDGGKDPQAAWLSHLLGILKSRNGLRFIIDDSGIEEFKQKIQKLPMVRFHSLTYTPVYETEDEYVPSISNPDRKMSQFVTFVGDTEQLYNLGWKIWAKGGPPLVRPPNKASGIGTVKKIAKAILKRTQIPMYTSIRPEMVAWAVRYGFHKLRSCALVSIRNNSVQTFVPMVNLDFKNAYDRDDAFWFGEGVSQKQYLTLKNKVLREMKMKEEVFAPKSVWFANNSLIGNMRSNSINDIFTLISFHMIQETLRTNVVGDCDFILNVRDFPKLRLDGKDPDHAVHGVMADQDTPVMDGYSMPEGKTIPFLGFNTHPNYADVPIVDPDTWASAIGGVFGTKKVSLGVSQAWSVTKEKWDKRQPLAVFRGSATGYGSGSDDNQRLFLAEMFSTGDPDVDYAITSGAVRDRKTSARGMRYLITPKIAEKVSGVTPTTKAEVQKSKRLPVTTNHEEFEASGEFTGQDKYRMVLYVDGNAGAYRYTSLMRAGFCILKVDSLVGYDMWMYPSLEEALPGSNTEAFLRMSNEEISALFKKDGDHIRVDKEGKTIRKIIAWSRSSPEAVEMTRLIAENAIKKQKSMCSPKVLTTLTALTLNSISKNQEWTVSHAPSLKDIKEPSVARDIIRTLDRVQRAEKEREAIMSRMDAPEKKADEEILQRFTRPSVAGNASHYVVEEKYGARMGAVEERLDEGEDEKGTPAPLPLPSFPSHTRRQHRVGPHRGMRFLTRTPAMGGVGAAAAAAASASAAGGGAAAASAGGAFGSGSMMGGLEELI